MNNPIFQNTSQAIHFSFLIEAYEPGSESATGKMMRRHMEEMGLATGEREESTIDFGGLTALEIRGQAAMIRSAVNSHLNQVEAWAIKAKFGTTKTVEKLGTPKAYVFSAERIDAMRNISRHIAPVFMHHSVSEKSVLWLVAKACGEIEAVRPTFRDIEELGHGSKSTLCRVYPQLKKMLKSLENRAIDQLTPLFIREGIVPG